jgi:N-acetylglucosaminyl-diphospho-decaprenol L-rhamnosyltransferase
VTVRERARTAGQGTGELAGSGAPVTVAVVSFNTRELLLRCLDSLAAEVRDGRAEVWVIDNGSADGSAAAAREHAPWARVQEAEGNLGFGGAVNAIARTTAGPWLLVLNADTELEPGALGALLGAADAPRVGVVAPRLRLPSGATQHSVHPFPTLVLTLAFNLGLHRLWPPAARHLCLEGFWDPDQPRAVPWALGACLLVRREAFAELGGFDERQWMYAEDLDLGWRLAQRGWITRYEPTARVHHASGAATGPAFGDRQRDRFLAATYALLARRRGPRRMRATAALNIAGAAGRLAWMAPLALLFRRWRRPAAENRRWLRAHVSALRAVRTTSVGLG